MSSITDLCVDHLRLRLRPLCRSLASLARRQAGEINILAVDHAIHIGVSQVSRRLLSLADALATATLGGEPAVLTDAEQREQLTLREKARDLGRELPLDRLAAIAELDEVDIEALLVCAAAELDARFASIVAFAQDDAARRRPTIGLLASLTARSLYEIPRRRVALGRLGRVRRCRLIQAAAPSPSEIDEELILAPGVLDVLLGNRTGEFTDPRELRPSGREATCHVDSNAVERIVRASRDAGVSLIGVWGGTAGDRGGVVSSVADKLQIRVRTLAPAPDSSAPCDLATAAADAAALDQMLWVDLDRHPAARNGLDVLAHSSARICLTQGTRVHATALLAAGRYFEVELSRPSWSDRSNAWRLAIPELDATRAADLAARYRLGTTELAAIANTARTAAMLASNGHAANVADFVEPACAMLVQARSRQLAHVVTPKRGLAEVVLAPELERQVTELVQAFRAWPRIVETWGLGRAAAGGLKALFAGEPGTGKTLAAEAIAHELGLALVKIDLAQVVSKWVGETEKNLDIVFREAEDGNAVLFFDEAEALFGKRGEVRHGTDRYANLEVSYLLQRLESHDGLVVLASNLKGEIDDAFTRRFHSVLYFSRPGEAERRRLWRLALPPSVPLADDVDLGLLAKLDLTGAGIVAAVRTAALRAAQADAPQITASDLVFGIARQFQRESRLLTPTDLGRYGEHLRC